MVHKRKQELSVLGIMGTAYEIKNSSSDILSIQGRVLLKKPPIVSLLLYAFPERRRACFVHLFYKASFRS